MHRAEHVHVLRVEGNEAFEFVDALFARELYLQDGQLLHGLILREDATVLADTYVARDEDAFVLFAEGPHDLLASFETRLDAHPCNATVTSLRETHDVISLHGPYAWELLADFVGPEVIGLPYLTFFHDEHWSCYRAGKTGEFGYTLVIDREHTDALVQQLRALGKHYDLKDVDLPTLDMCALESWFYCIRFSGLASLSPLELQLQWRTSRRKTDFVGAEALAQRRRTSWPQLTMVRSDSAVSVDDRISFEGQPIGRVAHAAWSPTASTWLSLALLQPTWACAGIDAYTAAGVPLQTLTPPPLRNRSLFINPQRHSYHTRSDDEFPSICPFEPAADSTTA